MAAKLYVIQDNGTVIALAPSGDISISTAGAFTISASFPKLSGNNTWTGAQVWNLGIGNPNWAINGNGDGLSTTSFLALAAFNVTATAINLLGNIELSGAFHATGAVTLDTLLGSASGGTANGFTKFTGPTTTEKTFTLPNSNATLLYSGGPLGTPSSGTLTSLTGLPVATGISGLGTGIATALAINAGSAGAPVLFNGAAGTPSSLVATNATGTAAGLTAGVATILQNARTINGISFNGSANILTDWAVLFGAGNDGAIAGGAGTTTLTRDAYYSNVTLAAGDKLITAGYRVFISGILDITAADARAIQHTASGGMDGGNASGSTAGAIPTQTTNTQGSLAQILRGLAGKTGGNTTGVNGTAGAASSPANGGSGGASGAGGTGVAGSVAGGTTAAGGTITNTNTILRADPNLIKGVTLLTSGSSGASGGSGGGVLGGAGGSGGSGSGGAIACIFAATVNRGAGTPVGVIEYRGGVGGNGGTSPTATAGGGGGSGGGGGGWIHMIVGALTGAIASNALDASGGNGGGGGNGNTTGVGGDGAHGGTGGRITLINISAGTITVLNNTLTADTGTTAGSGTTGGTGGTGVVTRMDL